MSPVTPRDVQFECRCVFKTSNIHRHCLDRWLTVGSGTCPLCRSTVYEAGTEYHPRRHFALESYVYDRLVRPMRTLRNRIMDLDFDFVLPPGREERAEENFHARMATFLLDR